MGFTPMQVDQMSLWEFTACADGVVQSKGGKRSGRSEMSEERLRDLGVL
jgi:hypothetical protein